jgi:hypothetical protein
MKYWEIIADQLHAEGWSYGIASILPSTVTFASMHTAMDQLSDLFSYQPELRNTSGIEPSL